MKKNITLIMIALIGSFAFLSSCSKKSDSSPSYSMKATVGSTPFTATNCFAGVSGTILEIYGTNGTYAAPTFPWIAILIGNWNGSTGTFTFDNTLTTNWAEYYTSSSSGDASSSGSVVITSANSTTIVGTFSFTGLLGTTITGGSFTAKRL